MLNVGNPLLELSTYALVKTPQPGLAMSEISPRTSKGTKRCVDAGKWSRLLPQIGHFQLNSAPAQWVPKPEKVKKETIVEGAPGARASFSAPGQTSRDSSSREPRNPMNVVLGSRACGWYREKV